jgi:hypothetical protein
MLDAIWHRRSALYLVLGSLSACSFVPENDILPPGPDSGAITYQMRSRKEGNEPRELSNIVTGTVGGNSYLWQPWFMQTQGTVTAGKAIVTGGNAPHDEALLSGTVTGSIMPRSAFPTSITVSRSDSTIDGTLFAGSLKTNRAQLSQHLYLPDDWNVQTDLSYEDSDASDLGRGDSRIAAVDVNKTIGDSTFGLGLRHDENRFKLVNSGVVNDTTDLATFTHNYTMMDAINIQSSTTAFRSLGTSLGTGRNLTSIQGVSTAQWRPGDGDLNVTGALRTLSQSLKFSGPFAGGGSFGTSTQLFSGLLGANYPLADRLSASVGVSGQFQSVKTQSDGPNNLGVRQGTETAGALASLNYYSLEIPVLGFDYSWNASSSLQGQFGDKNSTTQLETTTVGHQLRKPLSLPFAGDVEISASQAARMTYATFNGLAPGIAHSVALSKSLSENNSQLYARVSASDTRDLGGKFPTTLDLLEAQLTRQSTIDATRSWTAALTLQMARQTFLGQNTGVVTLANGNAGYFEREVFGIPNLNFRSDLTLNAIGLGDQLDRRPLSDTVYSQWGNRLEYLIGKLVLSAEERIFRRDGHFGDLLVFQVKRYLN